MAQNSTVFRAELQVSDMDRNYYATHALTLARHPSETDERMMVRVLAFALYADERLEFGRGVSDVDEPDLWQRALTGDIERWIELGQPDESRLRKACGRAAQVVVVNYAGRAADPWWEKNSRALSRFANLTVIAIDNDTVTRLAGLVERGMRLQCMIQDGAVELYTESDSVTIGKQVRMAPAGAP